MVIKRSERVNKILKSHVPLQDCDKNDDQRTLLTRRGILVRIESGDCMSTRPSLVLFNCAAEKLNRIH